MLLRLPTYFSVFLSLCNLTTVEVDSGTCLFNVLQASQKNYISWQEHWLILSSCASDGALGSEKIHILCYCSSKYKKVTKKLIKNE